MLELRLQIKCHDLILKVNKINSAFLISFQTKQIIVLHLIRTVSEVKFLILPIMNTSGSKDLTRKYRKRISMRNKRGQGYFYSSHNYNLINRNYGFQANSVGFSDYVLHNPNTRSYNTRFYSNRTNLGYLKPRLKHISSESIGRDKEHSSMGCYEEYTLRKIRTTSDMIKQQLMSPEHSSIASENERNMELDNVPSKVKCNQNSFSGETLKLSVTKEYPQIKLKRKPSKSAEEVSRLQIKEKRKNELREKFRKDKIIKQKSSESYNVKEISDKILQHISKMNNDKLVDFVNVDNSRYEEVFNYICKKKSFELTKALRDLSHQDKPEACEIVNSIIPDFSIKIEELPINIIKELSTTFDELHKNIENSSLPTGSLHFFNENATIENPNESSSIGNDTETNNSDVGIEMYVQNKGIKQENHSENTETMKSFEFIEIFDSDEEKLSLKMDTRVTRGSCDRLSYGMNKSIKSHESSGVQLNSSLNLVSSSNNENIQIGDPLSIFVPCVQEDGASVNSDSSMNSRNFQISCNISNVHHSIKPQTIDQSSNKRAGSEDFSLQNSNDDVHEKIEDDLGNTDPSLLEKTQDKVVNDETDSAMALKMLDPILQPKVGSVWVSRNIFEVSDNRKEADDMEFQEPNESHVENSEISVQENISPILSNLELSACEKNVMSTPVGFDFGSNTFKNLDSVQISENKSRNTYISYCESSQLQNANSVKDTPKNNVTISSPPTIGDDSFLAAVENDNHISENKNQKRKKKKRKRDGSPVDGSSNSDNIVSTDKHLIHQPQFTTQADLPSNKIPPNDSLVPMNVNSNTEEEFITLNIQHFNRPKNIFDALKFMKVIDQKIEILNKLRQDIFIGLSEIIASRDGITVGSGNRRLDDSAKRKITETESSVTVELSEKTEAQKEKESPAKIRPFSGINSVNGVVLFCKIVYDRSECIIGTDNGMIQYYNIYGNKPLMTVNIGSSAISFLEYVWIDNRNFVCTGNTTELELKILRYKKRVIERKIYLEDAIQALQNEWGYFFIGGKRGYLTRYDLKSDRIQYEDRISDSGIKDLKATREGPRKILVVLFEDADGEAHVHVRDAMTALHLRTIVDSKYVRCMYLKYSILYLVTDEEINIYNCCDGGFVKKLISNKSFSSMKSKSNLLILGCSDGIYALNMKTNEYLGVMKGGMSVSTLNFFNNQIICSTWEKKMELLDIPENFKEILGKSKKVVQNM